MRETTDGVRYLTKAVLIVLCVVSVPGCINTRTDFDETMMRRNTQEYYRKQVNECLVRASRGQLFIWETLGTEQATVSAKLAATAGGGQTLVRTGQNQILPVLANTLTNQATRPFTFSVTPETTNQTQVVGNPSDNPGHYVPILQFLNYTDKDLEKGNPLGSVNFTAFHLGEIVTLVRATPDWRPQPDVNCVADSVISYDGETYYVPLRFKGAYFDLCMAMLTKNGLNTYTGSRPVPSLSSTTKASGKHPTLSYERIKKSLKPLIKPVIQTDTFIENQQKIKEKLDLLNGVPIR